MSSVKQNPSPDPRRATRFPVEFKTICETQSNQEMPIKIVNISAIGMMLSEVVDMEKGDRVTVRLPVAGRIEAYLVWSHEGRSGFKFERVIREPDFLAMLDHFNAL